MKTLAVMVGLPATGKSTLVEEILQTYKGAHVISTDAYIEKVASTLGKTYDDLWEFSIKEATFAMNEQAEALFKRGEDMIWDQTNLGQGKRRKLINRAKSHGYHCYCYSVIPAKRGFEREVLEKRLANRPGKTVPAAVIENMFETYVVPSTDEGFEMVRHFDMHGNTVTTEWK